MREISLHIMDVAENGITAGADCIHIEVNEARKKNLLKVVISDNGKGIPAEMLKNITDPFVTSRTTRRVGLGLSLLEAASKRCAGEFKIVSEPGRGTQVTATFQYDHIDRMPIGDMPGTIMLLIAGNAGIDFVYTHIIDGKDFTLDTGELKNELSLTDPMVVFQLTGTVRKAVEALGIEKQV